ncbi:hypothetical protein ACFS2C_00550 [Prauserella oleivorans]|uniref:DUF3592 domain-containing protein n=1 Tax=Prauserella oleivorans TaxID=1478153 RepID=A0ABW5W1V0_9PSEU
MTESPERSGSDQSAGSTFGFIAIVVAALAAVVGLIGYGLLSVVNGAAAVLGIGERVDIHVIRDQGPSRHSPELVGEYTVDGQAHEIGMSDVNVGDVVEGWLGPLPWLNFGDPIVGGESWLHIGIGLLCIGILVVPALLMRKR